MDQQKIIVNFCLKCFDILGVQPYKKTRILDVTLTITSYLIFIILVYARFFYEDLSFLLISDTFESSFTITHAFSKYLVLVFTKSKFKILVKTFNSFWYLPQHEEFHNEIKEILKKVTFVGRFFTGFMILAIITFNLRLALTGILGIACYIPESIPRSAFYVFHYIFFSIYVFTVACFDVFNFSTILLIAIQHKTLNYVISTLNIDKIANTKEEEECINKIQKCVDYHVFLRRCLYDLSSMMSPALLINFSIAPIIFCFELYFISKNHEFSELAKSVVYIFGIMFQLFFLYCIPATYLMIEAEKLMNTIYNTGWESSPFLKVRKDLIIMMQRCQEETVLTAGKMIAVNMRTCTKAFQMGFSFYTSLNIFEN